jgi:hypothetical protein
MQRGFARAVLTAALGAAVATGSGSARAEPEADRATAGGLVAEAAKLLAEGQVYEACPKLEQARRLAPSSEVTEKLAGCYERAGRKASAWSLYLEVAAVEREAHHLERAAAAGARARALEPSLSRLSITVVMGEQTPGLAVRRDGVEIAHAQWGAALPLDPGPHTIVATAPGRYAWQTTVVVGAAGATTQTVVPELPAAATAQPPFVPAPLSRRERRELRLQGERYSVAMMVTGIVLASSSPLVGVGAGLGASASGVKDNPAVGVGFGTFLGLLAIGIPLAAVGAHRVQPETAQGSRLELTVSPGCTGLTGTF